MKNQYFDLLKLWADSLLEYQITEGKHPEFVGGVMCPACQGMHGRIADCMRPLVYLYSKTGDKKYYESARLIFKWFKNNMFREKGQFINDANSIWYGITEFFNVSLGELLFSLKDYIEADDYKEWFEAYKNSAEYVYNDFYDNPNWNINYRIGTATCMALAWRLLGDEKYLAKAHEFAKISLEHITEDGIIFGEGKPTNNKTAGGDYHVDLGYNVEESLPNLAIYLKYIDEDKEMEQAVVKSMKTHLEFMLPDGGWDNTWGSRNAKWTYWGSRTCDGCFDAYEHFAEYDQAFFEAAHRSFELLKKCTVNGLLAGGLHHEEMGEPCCVHHTFCHMKGLMCMAETEFKRKENVKLFRETFDGIKTYDAMRVHNARRGGFVATFSAVDNTPAVVSGGAVAMLYHMKAGLLLAAGQDEYTLVEAHNMQVPKIFLDICQSPRIEKRVGRVNYRNTYDRRANVQVADDGSVITYKADGILRDKEQNGQDSFSVEYSISEAAFKIKINAKTDDAEYILPVVSTPDEKIEVEQNKIVINKSNCKIVLESNNQLSFDNLRAERIFAAQGGLATAWIRTKMENSKDTEITITIQ